MRRGWARTILFYLPKIKAIKRNDEYINPIWKSISNIFGVVCRFPRFVSDCAVFGESVNVWKQYGFSFEKRKKQYVLHLVYFHSLLFCSLIQFRSALEDRSNAKLLENKCQIHSESGNDKWHADIEIWHTFFRSINYRKDD